MIGDKRYFDMKIGCKNQDNPNDYGVWDNDNPETAVCECVDAKNSRIITDLLNQAEAEKTTKLVCPECKGSKIWCTAWLDANTGEPVDSDPPLDVWYCVDCDETTKHLDEVDA